MGYFSFLALFALVLSSHRNLSLHSTAAQPGSSDVQEYPPIEANQVKPEEAQD
jgi:hypothetical protein